MSYHKPHSKIPKGPSILGLITNSLHLGYTNVEN